MDKWSLNIVVVVLMLPVNLYCSFWIFKEMLNLAGVTFKEFQEHFANTTATYERNERQLLHYFTEKTGQPEKIKKMLHWYKICTFPGITALLLAQYGVISHQVNKVKYVFWGNLVLAITNFIIASLGRIYRQNNPLDPRIAEQLELKRAREKQTVRKYKMVYALCAAFFISVLLGIHLAEGRELNLQSAQMQQQNNAQSISFWDMHTVLHQRGFETANIPTTYWFYDEDKLKNVISGKKGETSFEFYEYSDGETTDSVYSRIADNILQDMELSQRAQYETELPGRNKMFAVTQNGVYRLTMYKSNTVIYAYSTQTSDETHDILVQIGYIE